MRILRHPTLSRSLSKKCLPGALAAVIGMIGAEAKAADSGNYAYSPQDVLIGASAVAASANYGAGVVFADIDTGTTPQWVGFSSSYNGMGLNNTDTKDSAVCIGSCPTGATPTDQNGHGTFTASEIVGGVQSVGLQGVAPAGTMISVQVLNAQGSGSSTDIANGIIYAVNHGAEVLNLSLGPTGTAAQQAAFYDSIASAVNYAASKGAYVIFAGGNSSAALAGGQTITGYTTAAIQHIMFMGSTNASQQLSSFSNTPGTGGFLSTTGKLYADDTLWMMADGENIWGASNYSTKQYGYSYITQMSGTSMAAPQATGSIGLLIDRWPILLKNGTAAEVLEATGTDLGAKGVDTTYGEGFLNLNAAFQPIGALSVITASGSSVPVSQVTSSMLTGGALGSLSSISSLLKNYTAFDTYSRNFTVDLSGLLTVKPSVSTTAAAVTAPKVTSNVTKLTDGSSLAFGVVDMTEANAEQLPSSSNPANPGWFMSLTNSTGANAALGNGLPASASFSDALWGTGSVISSAASSLSVSNSLLDLASGGQFFAFGMPFGDRTRVAFSWTQTAPTNLVTGTDWTQPDASAFGAGVTTQLTNDWTAGVTFGELNEHNSLLGTTYDANGPLGFNSQNHSTLVGVSSAFNLAPKTSLLIDAAMVETSGTGLNEGLISNVSSLYSRTWGMAVVERDALEQNDNVSLSLRAPLTVYAGSANMTINSVDSQGDPISSAQKIGLRPTGSEMDLTAGYQAPTKNGFAWNFAIEGRQDADDIAGATDIAARVGMSLSF